MPGLSNELIASVPAGAHVLEIAVQPALRAAGLPLGCRYHHFGQPELPPLLASQVDVILLSRPLRDPADLALLLELIALRGIKGILLLSDNAAESAAPVAGPELRAMIGAAGLSARFGEPRDGRRLVEVWAALPPKPKRSVAVLSYPAVGNFGDRLGFHILNALMPSHCEVEYLDLMALPAEPKRYDLVIVGIGNSVFCETFRPPFFRIVDEAKRVIGIFGTQYRDVMPRPELARLLERTDTWFARNKEDILLYGREHRSAFHLGDWQISQFPMAVPSEEALLVLGQDIWDDLPLDRMIQKIQRHRRVFSPSLHPLLCALTSAEQVSYRDQRQPELSYGQSGKFRSMLLDVFDRTYPEESFFDVDREAVVQYRDFVLANLPLVGEAIGRAVDGT